jgi:hypothetical protein
MLGIISFGSQICMPPCKYTIKNMCDVLDQKLPTLPNWWLFKDWPVCMDCLYMYCLSNFHTNNYHMESDQMSEKAKRTNNLSPKNVMQDIHWIMAVQAVTMPSQKESLFFLLITHILKKWYKTLHCNFLNLLPLKRSWVQLFLLHWQHTTLQNNTLNHCV